MKPGEKGVIKAFRHGLIEYRKRLLALGALYLLIRKFRKGECNCGSCSKSCPAKKFKER